jgi:hypothetical protein
LKNQFKSGSAYSKADALPSALKQIVVFKELTDAKGDFIHNEEVSTKAEPIYRLSATAYH